MPLESVLVLTLDYSQHRSYEPVWYLRGDYGQGNLPLIHAVPIFYQGQVVRVTKGLYLCNGEP